MPKTIAVLVHHRKAVARVEEMFGIPEDIVEQQNARVRDAFSHMLEATGGTGAGSAEDIDPE